jgi:hypothetical protein
MAAPINTPSTGDIWHLSIDDLFAPLPEKTYLGGPGPFVINLSASTAPIDVPTKTFEGGKEAHVYQVQRMEDRRMRYRLRFGPFAKEEYADAILQKVRDIYPGALTATADQDDLRAIATLQAKSEPPQPPAQAVSKAAALRRTPPVAVKPAQLPPAAVRPVPPAMPPPVSPPVLTSALKVPVRAPAAAPSPSPNHPAPRQPVQVKQPVQVNMGVPSFETTQTIRALTTLELEDDEASRWFVIQLSLAEQAFDPETVPNLDIFSVYRLYSVAGIDQGRIVHALRLGFFSEEIAASAVASYLTAFYDQPAIKRVSAAERQRFAEQSLEPRKDVGATGRQAVIEITNERYIRERRIGQAAGK